MLKNAMIVTCPSCSKQNRLPSSRAHDKAKCAACKTALLPLSHPVPIASAADFDELIADSPDPVVVDFWAAWCGPCRMVAPELEKLAGQRAGRVIVAKVDTEALPEIASRFGIRSIPTMILFRNGKEAKRLSGAMPADAIAAELASDVPWRPMQPAPPVRPILLSDVHAAWQRIKGVVMRTPLVKLRHDAESPEIWLKLENLQPINSFKLRGAANAVAMLTPEARSKGVWTISAGNAGQGVAFAARNFGVPCTVITIETAPETKIDRMRKLGARIVKTPFDACWRAMEEREFPGVEGTFVHPFDDHDFIAGNATMGLEILEDLPNVKTVIAAVGGGGLLVGVGSSIRATAPHVRILGAEPETAAPAVASFAAGEARVFDGWTSSFVDGAGGKSMFPRMWQRMQGIVDASVVVSLDETRRAMRVIAEKARVIAEGAGALGVAAALAGRAGDGPIVAVVSGGNIDLAKFAELTGAP